MYNNLKYWNDLKSAAAEFNLRIDDWSSADDDRREWIQKQEETFHLEREGDILIF